MTRRQWLILTLAASAWAWYTGLGSFARGQEAAPILVKFSATWCQPCNTPEAKETLKRLASRGYDVRIVDVSNDRDTMAKYGVTKLPTFIAYRNNREVGRRVGATSEAELIQLLGPLPKPAAPPAPKYGFAPQTHRPNQSVYASIVRIQIAEAGGSAYGSGTVVERDGDQGLILTAAHVVQNPGQFSVHFRDGKTARADVEDVYTDATGSDLGAIGVTMPNDVQPIRLASSGPKPGEICTTIGYGGVGKIGWWNNIFRGVFIDERTRRPVLEFIGKARPGDSGGPILNEQWELCGAIMGINPIDEKDPQVHAVSGPGYEPTCAFIERVRKRWRERRQRWRAAPDQQAAPKVEPPQNEVNPGEPFEVPKLPPGAAPGLNPNPPAATPADPGGRDTIAPPWNPKPGPDVNTPKPPATEPPKDEQHSEPSTGSVLDTVGRWAVTTGLTALTGGAPWAAAGGAVAWWILKRRVRKRIARRDDDSETAKPPPVNAPSLDEESIIGRITDRLGSLLAMRNSAPATAPAPVVDPALQDENARLREQLAATQQPVVYASPAIGDNLPRMRQAMKTVSDYYPHLRTAVKLFEESYALILSGEKKPNG